MVVVDVVVCVFVVVVVVVDVVVGVVVVVAVVLVVVGLDVVEVRVVGFSVCSIPPESSETKLSLHFRFSCILFNLIPHQQCSGEKLLETRH